MSDQPFWARRVHELGAGPPPVPRAYLSVKLLAEGIHRAVTNPTYRYRAGELGGAIRAEDGVDCAVRLFEEHVQMLGIKSKSELPPLRPAA
jgi:UDP:flavonoid glycosyltransferase YjiC (YdhE family)